MKLRPHTPPTTAVFTMCILVIAATRLSGFEPTTRIAVEDGFWEINGKPTYEGAEPEGLLMGVRMVNCTFDDRNAKTSPRGFDADKNTEAFLKKLPRYISHGTSREETRDMPDPSTPPSTLTAHSERRTSNASAGSSRPAIKSGRLLSLAISALRKTRCFGMRRP